jgi:hypothetical protein
MNPLNPNTLILPVPFPSPPLHTLGLTGCNWLQANPHSLNLPSIVVALGSSAKGLDWHLTHQPAHLHGFEPVIRFLVFDVLVEQHKLRPFRHYCCGSPDPNNVTCAATEAAGHHEGVLRVALSYRFREVKKERLSRYCACLWYVHPRRRSDNWRGFFFFF